MMPSPDILPPSPTVIRPLPEIRPGPSMEQKHPRDLERLDRDWNRAIKVVWGQNRALLDRDFATEATVTEEFRIAGKTVSDPAVQAEIQAEVAKRTQEKASAETLDLDQIAQQLQLNLTDPAQRTQAEAEKNRREGLLKAKETLYVIHDCMTAATSPEAQALINAEIKRVLDETNTQRIAQGEPPLTELPEAQKAGITAQYIQDHYYDEETGIFYRVGADKKPIPGQTVQHADAYKPVFEEVQRIADPQTPNIEPSHRAGATDLLKTLHFNDVENAFVVSGFQEYEAQEAQRTIERIQETGRVVLEGILKRADEMEDVAKSEVYGEVSSLSLLWNKLRQETDPRRRSFLSAILYEHLQDLGYAQKLPLQEMKTLLASLPDATRQQLTQFLADESLSNGVLGMKRAFIKAQVEPVIGEDKARDLNERHLFRTLGITAAFVNHGVKPADIDRNINELIRQGLEFSIGDKTLIQAFSDKDYAEARYEAVLESMGITIEEMGEPQEYLEQHAKEIAEETASSEDKAKAEWQGNLLPKRESYLLHQASFIEKFFSSRKLKRPQILMLLLAGGSLLPLIQGTLNIGVSPAREEGQG